MLKRVKIITYTIIVVFKKNFKKAQVLRKFSSKKRDKHRNLLQLASHSPACVGQLVICNKENNLNIPLGAVGTIQKVLSRPHFLCKFPKIQDINLEHTKKLAKVSYYIYWCNSNSNIC